MPLSVKPGRRKGELALRQIALRSSCTAAFPNMCGKRALVSPTASLRQNCCVPYLNGFISTDLSLYVLTFTTMHLLDKIPGKDNQLPK